MTQNDIIILDNAIQYLNRYLFRDGFIYNLEYIDKQNVLICRDCDIDSKDDAINKLRKTLNAYTNANLSYVRFIQVVPIFRICKLFEPIDVAYQILETSPFDPLYYINNWLYQFKPNGMEYRIFRLSNRQVKIGYSNLFNLDEIEFAITEIYNAYCEDCNKNEVSCDLLLVTDHNNKIIEKFELYLL